jgi:hypothetical protein
MATVQGFPHRASHHWQQVDRRVGSPHGRAAQLSSPCCCRCSLLAQQCGLAQALIWQEVLPASCGSGSSCTPVRLVAPVLGLLLGRLGTAVAAVVAGAGAPAVGAGGALGLLFGLSSWGAQIGGAGLAVQDRVEVSDASLCCDLAVKQTTVNVSQLQLHPQVSTTGV